MIRKLSDKEVSIKVHLLVVEKNAPCQLIHNDSTLPLAINGLYQEAFDLLRDGDVTQTKFPIRSFNFVYIFSINRLCLSWRLAFC